MSDHLVVIPAFDEAPTLGAIVAEARRHGSVLVVDDGSADDTAAVASAAGADVVRLDRRHGKGEALRRGFREGLARGVDRLVTLDADGQHDPTEIARLLKAAQEAPDALVIGGRLGGQNASAMPAGRLAALRVAGFFINWLTGVFIADTQSGFRVYPVGLLRQISPRHGRFVLETEMLVRSAAAGWRLVEVPIATIQPPGRRSRFRAVRDGVEVGAYLARHIIVRWGRDAWLVLATLLGPFSNARRRRRHRALAEFLSQQQTGSPGAWAMAAAVFTGGYIVDTWRRWLSDPRAHCMRTVAAATVATPALLALAVTHGVVARRGDSEEPGATTESRRTRPPFTSRWLQAFTERVYSQERLARVLPAPRPTARAATPSSRTGTCS